MISFLYENKEECHSTFQVKHHKCTPILHYSTSATKNKPNKAHYHISLNIHEEILT
jgi:hypothetical protein